MRWQAGKHRGPYVEVRGHYVHRPGLSSDAWWDDETHTSASGYVELCWGDGRHDPVWAIGAQFRVPRWYMRFAEWLWTRRHGVPPRS